MGCLGNVLATFATRNKSFAVLCVGGIFCGIANAYFNFLRFEAVRFVPKKYIPYAVSTVVAGGVIGGGLGPIISRFTRDLLQYEFEATFLLAVGLWFTYLVAIPTVQFHKVQVRSSTTVIVPGEKVPSVRFEESGETDGLKEESFENRDRSAWEILSQPDYFISVLSGTTSYAIMATIMLASIVALKAVDPSEIFFQIFRL